jgi:hydroxymethylglutaryl-CoA lyase
LKPKDSYINKQNSIELIECPRDAMQGWKHFIPTDQKIQYLNALLKVGFSVLDCGSFVSPKAIPQMADTAQVIGSLMVENTNTKLLVIVANYRGAEEAVRFAQIDYIGFPLSLSPTFQKRNTNAGIEEALLRIAEIQTLCLRHGKKLVVYLSMGFGNPYGDAYSPELLNNYTAKLVDLGIDIVSLADTIGIATPEQVAIALTTLMPMYPSVRFGVHLHATSLNWDKKLQAAIHSGCLRFDGAINGIGGCPMAQDDLVGNMDTLQMLPFFRNAGLDISIDEKALSEATLLANLIFR